MARRLLSEGPGDTEAAGAELARTLGPGDVVLVEGELGAGKTTFVRGAARALGVTGVVNSPTFTIGQRYPAAGDLAVSHIDLFRIDSLQAEDPELLADYIHPEAVAFVEWPQGEEAELAALGPVAARVRIEHAGGDRRTIELEP